MRARTADDLRRWRESRGFTQTAAAHWYGVSLRQWQRYEDGVHGIPRPLTARIEASHREPTPRPVK